MPGPTWRDIAAYGARAFEVARKRDDQIQAQEVARSLLELGATPPAPTPMVDSPAAPGVKVPTVSLSEQGLQFSLPDTSPEALQANLPQVLADGGYDPMKILGARLQQGQLDDQAARLNALHKVLNDPTLDPTLAADVANKRKVSDATPTLVKVRRRDGSEVYYNQRRRGVSGEFDYTPATDASSGQALAVPTSPGAGEQLTTLQKDTAFIARTLNISSEDAVRLKLALKTKSPQEAWADTVRAVMTMEHGRYSRQPDRLRQKAQEIWSVARPGEPIPQLAAPTPAAPAPAGPAQVPASAPAAPTGPTPNDIKAAYKAGRLTRDQALAALKAAGYQ